MRRSLAPSLFGNQKKLQSSSLIENQSQNQQKPHISKFKPLFTSSSSSCNIKSKENGLSTSTKSDKLTFSCVWRKKQFKKHKTWDGDGKVIATVDSLKLVDMEDKELGFMKNTFGLSGLKEGLEINFGAKDVELGSVLEGEQQNLLTTSQQSDVEFANGSSLSGSLTTSNQTSNMINEIPHFKKRTNINNSFKPVKINKNALPTSGSHLSRFQPLLVSGKRTAETILMNRPQNRLA